MSGPANNDALLEAIELIEDLRNALARERGGGSPLDPMSYRLLHSMAGEFLKDAAATARAEAFNEDEDEAFYRQVMAAESANDTDTAEQENT